MMGLDRKPLRQHPLASGSPRHWMVRCARHLEGCAFRGQRTADSAEDIPLGRRCPRCGSKVEVASP